MRFAHLQLRNWRNFADAAFDIADRAFVVGPNASGKSNLIDAFRFLQDIATPEGGLQRAIADRGGLREIRFLGAPIDAAVGIDVTLHDEQQRWRYVIQCKTHIDGGVVVSQEHVSWNDLNVLQRPDPDDLRDPLRLRQTALEQVATNFQFRSLADSFNSIQYIRSEPDLIRGGERSRPIKANASESDLLNRIVRTPQATMETRLRRINDVLRAALPQLDRINVEMTAGGEPHLWVRFKHWRPTAGPQNELQLSDGTLRLFGLLWALLEDSGPLLLEEPELSLHPALVRHLVSLIHAESPRQTIISTHSLDLLSDEGIALEEVLLLEPTSAGTRVTPASNDDQIRALLEGGMPIGDAVLPGTSPPRAGEMLRSGSES